MSFLGYRVFLIFFSVSRSSLTSNVHDVEAKKTHGWPQKDDDLDAKLQIAESRCQTRDLDAKKGDLGHLDTPKKDISIPKIEGA